MLNATSLASLSRLSHPNDSDSSFRNAYEEYKNSQVPKAKRKDSPLTKIEKSHLKLLPGRNTEVSDLKGELDTDKLKLDRIYKIPTSFVVRPNSKLFSQNLSTQKRNLDMFKMIENSKLSQSYTTQEHDSSKHINTAIISMMKRESMVENSYSNMDTVAVNPLPNITSLPPLRSGSFKVKAVETNSNDESDEELDSINKEGTLTGLTLSLPKSDTKEAVKDSLNSNNIRIKKTPLSESKNVSGTHK